MRKSAPLLACLVFAPLALAADDSERGLRLSEPVTVTAEYEEFGAALESADTAMSLTELVRGSDRYLGQEVTVSTRIAKVCRKKGCFFIAREGDTYARVTFRDYAFFIPTDSAGRQVTLNGVFRRQEVSPEQARHYREDLGESSAEPPAAATEYHIVATAIRIPRG